MTDSLFQRMGEMRMPATASDVDDTALSLASLDPARDTMLGLFAAALNFELGAAWAKAIVGTPLAGKRVVNDTWPGPPAPEAVLQRKADLPILFLSRDGAGKYDDHSLALKQLTQTWGLHYILSPIGIGDYRKLGDILTRVGTTVLATIERKGHPAYQSGSAVLYTAGLASLNITTVQAGQAKFADGDKNAPAYHALSMELVSTEIAASIPGTAADWRGVGWSISSGNADGLIQPFVQFDSESYQPTMEQWAIDPATAAALGTGSDTLVTPGGDTLIDA